MLVYIIFPFPNLKLDKLQFFIFLCVFQQKDFFSKMVVDAVSMLDELLPLNMIGIKKVQGGSLEDSVLVSFAQNFDTFSTILNYIIASVLVFHKLTI